ncbi:MAG: serine protease, partial [Bacteroidetes bacterium]|nr:serine protease [Bacteroidota bacterium]
MKLKFLALQFICCSLLMTAQTTSTWNGTGVVLSSEGYIATSNHNLEPGYHFEIDVFNKGVKKTFRGRLEKSDPVNDLA